MVNAPILLMLPANTIFEGISKLAPEDSSMSKGQPRTVAPKEPNESIFTRFTVAENAPVYIFSPYLAIDSSSFFEDVEGVLVVVEEEDIRLIASALVNILSISPLSIDCWCCCINAMPPNRLQ